MLNFNKKQCFWIQANMGWRKWIVFYYTCRKRSIHSGEIFQDVEEIFSIGVLLGGDHGKGKMIFVAVIILRFRTKRKPPKSLRCKSEKWTAQKKRWNCCTSLYNRWLPDRNNNTRKDGKAVLKVERKIKQVKYEINVIYDEYNELGSLNADCLKVDC